MPGGTHVLSDMEVDTIYVHHNLILNLCTMGAHRAAKESPTAGRNYKCYYKLPVPPHRALYTNKNYEHFLSFPFKNEAHIRNL